ncbi:MAG: DUF2818 family protein [Burkholderiaceae bacterium]
MSAIWVILAGLVLATLPMLGDRSVFAIPLLKSSKSAWVRVLEFVIAYAIWILVGRLLEAQVNKQGWQFYVVTFLLFIVAAFPAFAWRYLWRRA